MTKLMIMEVPDILEPFFFFYKQVFYNQPQAQIAKNLSTLLCTLSASDLVSKVTLLKKLLLVTKNIGENVKTMQIC